MPMPPFNDPDFIFASMVYEFVHIKKSGTLDDALKLYVREEGWEQARKAYTKWFPTFSSKRKNKKTGT